LLGLGYHLREEFIDDSLSIIENIGNREGDLTVLNAVLIEVCGELLALGVVYYASFKGNRYFMAHNGLCNRA
jgi:hypothetical protein